MDQKKLIVVTLNGFAPAGLGCYGSSWNQTPHLDQLAATGSVWDRWTASSDDPLVMFKRWMEDSHWLSHWQSHGPVELISDQPEAVNLATQQNFDQLQLIDALEATEGPAEEIESTQFAQLVASAIERINDPEPWSVLWLHSDFLAKRWDAPRWFAESGDGESDDVEPMDAVEQLEWEAYQASQEADEHAPPPPVFDQVDPPQVAIDKGTHPDLIFSWMTTYACQLRLVDELIAVLAQSAGDATIVISGASGMALGQNGWIGHQAGPLRSCHLRLPLIVSNGAVLRHGNILDAGTLPQLLSQLSQTDTPVDPQQWCQTDGEFAPFVTATSAESQAITSSRWFMVDGKHLFLKPDDVDDVNDVSRLRPDVIEQLL